MLRQFAATLRTIAAPRPAPPAATVLAILLLASILAGCGIKGPLKLPPAASPPAPAATKPGAPAAPAESVPPAEPAPPAKP